MKVWAKIEDLGRRLNKQTRKSRSEIKSLEKEEESYQYNTGYLDGQIDTTESVVAELRPLWGSTKKEWERAEKRFKEDIGILENKIKQHEEHIKDLKYDNGELEEKIQSLDRVWKRDKQTLEDLKEEMNNRSSMSVDDKEYIEIVEREKREAWEEARKYFSVEVDYLKRVMRDNGLDPDSITDAGSSHD